MTWEFLFQYPIILPFHTVHGVLKARVLKWFAIPFSSGPHSVRNEELPYVQGKEQRLCFAGAAVKRYPTPKVRETQVLQEGIRGQTH